MTAATETNIITNILAHHNKTKETSMKKNLIVTIIVLASLSATAADTQVYNWKDSKGNNVYSDTPRNMREGESGTINLRTGTVTAPVIEKTEPTSLIEMQAQLNEKIIAENRRREEENNRLIAETKAENCKTARMNLDTVNKSNARNKDDLIPKYNADIAKYCN